MSAIEIVDKILTADPDVKQLCKWVFPINAPQNQAPPYYVLNLSGGNDQPLLSGAGQYYRHRVSVEAVAGTGTLAVQMGSAALTALRENIKAEVIVGRARYIDVDIIFANVDETTSSPSRDVFVRLLQFNVMWRRAA